MINEYKVFFSITIFIDLKLFSFLECFNLILVRYEFLLGHQGLVSEFWQSHRVTCGRKKIANCSHEDKGQHRRITNLKEQIALKLYFLSSECLGQTVKQDMFQIYFDLCWYP